MKQLKWLAICTLCSFMFCANESKEYAPGVKADGIKSSITSDKMMNEEVANKSRTLRTITSTKKSKSRMRFGKSDKEKDIKNNRALEPLALEFSVAKKRMLEYSIRLNYTVADLQHARKELLAIIARYGFIKSSTATASSSYPYMNSEFVVKSTDVYKAMQELDAIGKLTSERIYVTDHTPSQVQNAIKQKRARMRIIRKQLQLKRTSTSSKNWAEVNSSTENSENNLDASAFKKWQLKDRVAWAKMHVYLTLPERSAAIEVPTFRNAFIELLNGLLGLLYGLIYLLPFAVIGLIVYLKWQAIKGIFRKKE